MLRRNADIVVVAKRGADQLLQLWLLKDLREVLIAERVGVAARDLGAVGSAEGGRRRDLRPRVLRPNRAAEEENAGDQQSHGRERSSAEAPGCGCGGRHHASPPRVCGAAGGSFSGGCGASMLVALP